MDLLRVVPVELLFSFGIDRSQWPLEVDALVLGAHHESDLARWVRWDCAVGVLDVREDGLACGLQVLDDLEVDPDALCLGGDDTVLSQGL